MRTVFPTAALALSSLAPAEDISFHRPEAWAMAYVASATIPTALGPVESREAWRPDAGLELGWLPPLDTRQETVGFQGTKQEDLGRLPVLGRLRLGLALPGEVRALLTWIPPLEIDGLRADFLALALERPLASLGDWRFGARLYGQIGRIDGDITCTAEDAAQPPGSPGNPIGCTGASDDTFSSQLAGLELQAARRLWADGPTAYAGVAGNLMRLDFQVRVNDYLGDDRTQLHTTGETISFTLGASHEVWRGLRLALEGFYTPLTVDRPNGHSGEHDGLANARLLATVAW